MNSVNCFERQANCSKNIKTPNNLFYLYLNLKLEYQIVAIPRPTGLVSPFITVHYMGKTTLLTH